MYCTLKRMKQYNLKVRNPRGKLILCLSNYPWKKWQRFQSSLGIRAATLSKDVIEDKLSDYMEEYPARFIAMVNDPNKKYRTFINKCLNKGILSIDGGAVVYNETILGYDTNSHHYSWHQTMEQKPMKH